MVGFLISTLSVSGIDYMKNEDEELEMVLASRMLDCLGAAIDQAHHSRQDIKSGERSVSSQPESFYAERLRMLDREIVYLQALQQKIRSKIRSVES